MQRELETVDVLIVGAGPAGVSTALHLVHKDPAWAGRILVLDKAVHPRDKLCGGGITHDGQNILARLGLALDVPSFPVHEVRLVYQDRSCSFRGNPVFRIARRDQLDHWLAQTAEKRGVTIRQGEAVEDVTPHADHVEVVTSRARIRARTVVAADGSRSIVRRKLAWDDESRVARLLEVLTPEDAADEIAVAFARQDFSFATYRQRILDDRFLRELPIRVAIARTLYRMRSPWMVRLLWRGLRTFLGFTRWRDPSYVPVEPPAPSTAPRAPDAP